MLLPVLSMAKAQGLQTTCMNNKKQLQSAWLLYASDFADSLPTCGATNQENDCGWCTGWMPNPVDATNYMLLEGSNSVLWPYIGSPLLFKCPCDLTTATIYSLTTFKNVQLPRVRSISMNGWMNGDSANNILNADPTVFTFRKTKDLVRPGPANSYVFLDECPATIDDDYFALDVKAPDSWGNWPGTYHNGGNCFSFADGHAEYHKWVDSNTLAAPLTVNGPIPTGTSPHDVYWAELHATALQDPSLLYPPPP